ncbi:MAG: hypothetical protein Q8Q08_10480 [Candidatus Omnitrophota bacterium]|nr:hypothetical protein [Candidatus Omnitrophota bacterium]MDZ4243201.1 hypothetical protein [Candidatus Omnitrophota bacterium]
MGPLDRRHYAGIVFGGLVVFLLMNGVIHKSISTSGPAVPAPEPADPVPGKGTADGEGAKKRLVPDDPAKYAITAYQERPGFKNQAQWDSDVRRSLSAADWKTVTEKNPALTDPTHRQDELAERRARIDERIKVYEKLALDRPKDAEVRRQLQSLYMLRATLTVLEEKNRR